MKKIEKFIKVYCLVITMIILISYIAISINRIIQEHTTVDIIIFILSNFVMIFMAIPMTLDSLIVALKEYIKEKFKDD